MKAFAVFLLLTTAASGVLARPAPMAAEVTIPAGADASVRTFLDLLKRNEPDKALDTIFTGSSLWSQKTGAREQMAGQIGTAIKVYGPISGYELVDSRTLGTMAVRQYWLVQHRNMVTRWEFDLLRTANGWSIGYFGFADQPNAWF